MNTVTSTLIVLFALTMAPSKVQLQQQQQQYYRYYYARPSYRSMYSKIDQLERKVNTLQKPVNVYFGGEGQNAEGTHVHVHMSLDGAKGGNSFTAIDDEYKYASCNVQPNAAATKATSVSGFVHLRQKRSGPIEIKVDLSGFPSGGQYGFHVHEVADFQNGCNSFSGHYNPYGKVHGGPNDDVRHVGDWGNLIVDRSGRIQTTMTDRLASLFGSESIVGRGIVIHAGTDDLGRGGNEGSLKTGNAGWRLACCAIGWTKSGPW